MQRTIQILQEHENTPRLPPVAARKLERMEAVIRSVMAEARAADEQHLSLHRILDGLESELVIAQTGGPGGSRAVRREAMEKIEEAIRLQKAKLRKSDRAKTEIEERRAVGNCHYRIKQWLDDLGKQNLPPFAGEVKPKVGARETKPEAIERIRREIGERRADRHRVASAPIPVVEAKAALRAEIGALAAAGAPSVDALAEGGKLRWPQSNFNRRDGTTLVYDAFDPKALFVWMHRDVLLERLEAELEATVDPSACLTSEQRQAEDARLCAEILRLEREEEALIEEHGVGVAGIYRREDADPRAVLGLSGDLPSPEDF